MFREFKDISLPKYNEKDYLKTGITGIDKNMVGFGKGQVVVVTGTRGGGKSTFMGQISLNFINNGYKGIMFNLEMKNDRSKFWLCLQACGKRNLTPQQTMTGKTVYYPKSIEMVQDIDNWLENKLMIYDNCSYNFSHLRDELLNYIEKNGNIDFVIVDNLMRMNIGDIAEDKWLAQIKIMKGFQEMAQKFNICVIFICHPNKVRVLPRIEDVSGSGDIINLADVVIIGHRVNDDFKIRAKEYFGWRDDCPMFKYANIWEVAKDREFGNDNLMVGTYFEPESKRFLNAENETTHYGWEKVYKQQGFVYIGDIDPNSNIFD